MAAADLGGASASDPPLGVRAGRYELFAEIGSGGMATVHLARLLSAGGFARTVAVKRPLPALTRDATFRRTATNEARLASRVYHPNVVATLDVIEEGSGLLVVMDYVHGESLALLMDLARARCEPVPIDVTRALIVGVLRGLHAVHQARDERGNPLGLVHADVSPQNVLCGSDGSVRIADFGLAKAAGGGHPLGQRGFIGKVTYASAEQFELGTLTPATDLYSAGLILWELLVGKRVHAGLTAKEIAARMLGGVIPRPGLAATSVPHDLDRIVEQVLSRDPAQRFESALAMAAAVETTGPLASVSEMAAWVQHLAGDELAHRERLVLAAERETTPSQRSSSLAPNRHRAGNGNGNGNGPSFIPVALRILGMSAGVGIGVTAVRLLAPEPSPPLRQTAIRPVSSQVSTAPLASAGPLAAPPSITTPSTSSGPTAHAAVPRGRPAEGKTLPDCSPPFFVDSQGIRHMRSGCR